jgi:hypothetical protein
VGLRDEQREVRVLMPGVLDPLVELGLEQFHAGAVLPRYKLAVMRLKNDHGTC